MTKTDRNCESMTKQTDSDMFGHDLIDINMAPSGNTIPKILVPKCPMFRGVTSPGGDLPLQSQRAEAKNDIADEISCRSVRNGQQHALGH